VLVDILVKRLHVLPLAAGRTTKKKKIMFLAELANMGYKITNPEQYNDSILEHPEIFSCLKKMKGGDVDYVPLFQGFPDNVPNEDEYFVKRIMGFLGNFIGLFDEGTRLDNDMVVPEWLFDIEQFGADPITQFQDEQLYRAGVKRQKKRKNDKHTVWTDLTFSTDSMGSIAEKYLLDILYAKSSIKEALKDDIEYLLGMSEFKSLGFVDPSKVVFKETKTHLMKHLWGLKRFENLECFINSPTDILRLFAALTNSDVSLATPITFPKLKRSERRFVLQKLNELDHLAQDMVAYKGLWLALGNYLHPSEYPQYKNTFTAFDVLRNGKVVTIQSKIEACIRNKDLDGLLGLIKHRPTIFARKLHHLLDVFKDTSDIVLSSFEQIANKIPLKNLLVLESYFKTISDLDYRAIINKKGNIKILDNKKRYIPHHVIFKLLDILRNAAIKVASDKESWAGQKVWIDKKLRGYTIPLQQRKASDGLLTLGRGSRIDLDSERVLRLFVYWKEKEKTTDLDLSLITYDENMERVGHISYTALRSNGMVHSGDIQSAPHGAAEFIDIDIPMKKMDPKIRYLVPVIYVYCGENFTELDCCYAGWSIRDNINDKYKSFNIKTVENKLDICGVGSYSIPMAVDLKEDKIIYVDLYVNSLAWGNRVENSHHSISLILKQLIGMTDTKPNMRDLAYINQIARGGELVARKGAADITIGINDCSFNVTEIEKILSELI